MCFDGGIRKNTSVFLSSHTGHGGFVQYDFDSIIDRRGGDSLKWNIPLDQIAMWYADADFASAPEIVQALVTRASHGVFGYAHEPTELRRSIVARMHELYQWHIHEEDIVPVPGIIPGFNIASRAFGSPGAGVVVQEPTFYPIRRDLALHHMVPQPAALRRTNVDAQIVYRYDPDAFEAACDETTRLATLCHPHNPTGLVFRRDDLLHMAMVCVSRGIVLCSDEIHCDIRLDDTPHIPIASLSEAIAHQTVTLMSPSKAFNIPGLVCGYAIIQNPDLRQLYLRAMAGMVPAPTIFAQIGTQAALTSGDPWLRQANAYYAANRDYAIAYIHTHMPNLRCTHPSATYLLWIDCSLAGIPELARDFFAAHGVALGDGTPFGDDCAAFVRLTLACPRGVLAAGLDAMRRAMATLC